MSRPVAQALAVSVFVFGSMSVYAAEVVDLSKKPVSILNSFISAPTNLRAGVTKTDEVKEVSRATDTNKTTHIRMQQYHSGVPVWGADSVVHVPNTPKNSVRFNALAAVPGVSMNGTMYQKLNDDLAASQNMVSNAAQIDKSKSKALDLVRDQYGASGEVTKHQLMVFVDDKNKAHWAYYISSYLRGDGKGRTAVRPTVVMDAVTFDVYESWNDIKTGSVSGGGYGGNDKTGKLVYDGLPGDLAALSVVRNSNGQCYMKNDIVTIYNANHIESSVARDITYPCAEQDSKHNNVFWNGSMDAENGAFSPDNDALYAGTVVMQLYKQWYKLPMLINRDGSPMMLRMYTHYDSDFENAEWDSDKEEIHLGDGADELYPLTSLGVVAHEVSHGFTSQHSDLVYANQSGSLYESFSDMAAQAAEQFAWGKTTWQIGPEIMKAPNEALRYMDTPSKDCRPGDKPGDGCSIDRADQFDALVKFGRQKYHLYGDRLQSYIVHLASGVFNHAFYYLATSEGWDVKKAFQVMIHANSFYWTKTSNFKNAACGVVKATKDLHYDTAAVLASFDKVGIDATTC
jgi:pseudolysin